MPRPIRRLGPWVYARKIVTHDKYSFYNPKQHPMFDKDGGRIIFFEGTYTTTFSGNPDPTPRYDYNQVMYQLDLSDPRLALPVAIYAEPSGPGGSARLVTKTQAAGRPPRRRGRSRSSRPTSQGSRRCRSTNSMTPRTVKRCTCLPRASEPGPAGVRPLFFILPADVKDYTAATVPFYEYREEGSGRRFYSVDPPTSNARSRVDASVAGPCLAKPGAFASW